MRRAYVPLVVIASTALVGLLVYGVIGAGGSTTLDDAVKAGERPPAPTRSLPVLDRAGEASLADWRGRPVLVNFWASWCDPCKAEAPLLNRAQRRLSARGGTVLGVTVSDSSEDSRRFAREHGLRFSSLRDVDGEYGKDFETKGVPESFAVDREGRIVAISRGQVDERFLDEALRRLGA